MLNEYRLGKLTILEGSKVWGKKQTAALAAFAEDAKDSLPVLVRGLFGSTMEHVIKSAYESTHGASESSIPTKSDVASEPNENPAIQGSGTSSSSAQRREIEIDAIEAVKEEGGEESKGLGKGTSKPKRVWNPLDWRDKTEDDIVSEIEEQGRLRYALDEGELITKEKKMELDKWTYAKVMVFNMLERYIFIAVKSAILHAKIVGKCKVEPEEPAESAEKKEPPTMAARARKLASAARGRFVGRSTGRSIASSSTAALVPQEGEKAETDSLNDPPPSATEPEDETDWTIKKYREKNPSMFAKDPSRRRKPKGDNLKLEELLDRLMHIGVDIAEEIEAQEVDKFIDVIEHALRTGTTLNEETIRTMLATCKQTHYTAALLIAAFYKFAEKRTECKLEQQKPEVKHTELSKTHYNLKLSDRDKEVIKAAINAERPKEPETTGETEFQKFPEKANFESAIGGQDIQWTEGDGKISSGAMIQR